MGGLPLVLFPLPKSFPVSLIWSKLKTRVLALLSFQEEGLPLHTLKSHFSLIQGVSILRNKPYKACLYGCHESLNFPNYYPCKLHVLYFKAKLHEGRKIWQNEQCMWI